MTAGLKKYIPKNDLFWMENLFDSFFEPMIQTSYSNISDIDIKVDIIEKEKEYMIKSDIPGLDKENIKLTFDDGILQISGERKSESEESKDKFYRKERRYGKFSRSFTFDSSKINTENISANYSNGTLSISIPKLETASKKLEIKID